MQPPIEITPHAHPIVVRAILRLTEGLNRLETELEGRSRSFITAAEAERIYGGAATRAKLQSQGSAPLNLTGLIGVSGQLQPAGVTLATSFSALPPINTQQIQGGALSVVQSTYTPVIVDTTVSPPSYKSLIAAVLGVGSGPSASIMAPAKAAGGGPTNSAAVVQFAMHIDNSGNIYWVPLFQ